MRGEVRLVRTGRSRVIGVGRLDAVADPSRVVGYGTVSIAVLGPLDGVGTAAGTDRVVTGDLSIRFVYRR